MTSPSVARANSVPTARDLTDPAQHAQVLALADELVADTARLDAAQTILANPEHLAATNPVEIEAIACAISAERIRAIATPVHLTVVWAMYKETERILTRDEHPHGEDFLFEKLRQIQWLADHNSMLSWNLVAVDDGCPNSPSSGDVAQRLIDEAGLGERICVLNLRDAIDRALPVTDGFNKLASPDDSRKGGSIAYGLWAALHGRAGVIPIGAEHVVLYTDADLSTNIAQAGSLILEALHGAAVAAGQRYGMPGAVLVNERGARAEPASTGSKPDKMIVLFRHFVRTLLFPQLESVADTQAGCKVFRANVLASALPRLDAFTETFDLELLLHAVNTTLEDVAAVPIVFTEDFAATNFPSVDPGQRHLDMVMQITEIHDRLGGARTMTAEGRALRSLLAEVDLDGYVRIIDELRRRDRASVASGNAIWGPMFDSRWDIDDLTEIARPR